MWLLDANMDVHLVSILTGFQISCETAAKRGWNSLSNGELVRAAVDAGFKCLLTRDQLFGESASQAPTQFSRIRNRRGERRSATLATISSGISRSI